VRGSRSLHALRSKRFARTVAAFCVVIACAFTAQATVVTLDRIEHMLDHKHEANPVAGSLQVCPNGAVCKGSNDHQDVSHVHIGDTVTVFILSSADAVLVPFQQFMSRYLAVGDQSAPPSQYPSLDRPPKA
jgi:hypothetical protein